ncbi:MAG: chaperonin GroEL [Anaerolineae bacterium]|nr:chaperonin GroEL [Anaerolineae bacterium]
MSTYGVLRKPEAGRRLKRGFDQLAELLALTLGPTQGMIVGHKPASTELEYLNDAATIARRMTELPDRGEDVGAMLLRNLVWRVHTRIGDGCATAAVLAHALLGEAQRAVAAGANPVLLRKGIDRSARVALAALVEQSHPIDGEEALISVAESVTGDSELSLVLGEMFDLVGPEAHITIEDYVAPYLEREYLDGGRWDGGVASMYLFTDPRTQRAVLSNCRVLLLDGVLETVDDVRPILDLLTRHEKFPLAILAREIKGEALNTLVLNHQRGTLSILAATLRQPGSQGDLDFEDLATLTGARIFGQLAGYALRSVSEEYLGYARRVEASLEELIVVGAASDHGALRAHIEQLRARIKALPFNEAETRDKLRARLGRLTGNTATLKIGAYTKNERALRRSKAEKALRALPLALREGVAPGGGVAFLNCIPAVQALPVAGLEEAWGRDIVARALEAPFRRIARNAGRTDAGALLAGARRRGPDYGFHALSGEIVSMTDAGILDATGVLRAALETATSGAVMALTTEVTVLKRKRRQSLEP